MSEMKNTLDEFSLTAVESPVAIAYSKGTGTVAQFISLLQWSWLGYAPLTVLLSLLALPFRAVLPSLWPSFSKP